MVGGDGTTESEGANGVLDEMTQALMESANAPPREVEGVSDEFLSDLERIPKKSLKKGDNCQICQNPFLDGQYPFRMSEVLPLMKHWQTHILWWSDYRATKTTCLTWSASLHG